MSTSNSAFVRKRQPLWDVLTRVTHVDTPVALQPMGRYETASCYLELFDQSSTIRRVMTKHSLLLSTDVSSQRFDTAALPPLRVRVF